MTGREALRAVFHFEAFGQGRLSQSGYTVKGCPWGAHFSARVQERILNIAIAIDAWVSAFENLFVQLTLEECRGFKGRAPVPPVLTSRLGPTDNDIIPDRCWEFVDSGSWGSVRAEVPSVTELSLPPERKVSSRAQRALEARSHAVRTQNRQGAVRGWKLFCMLLVMLRHRNPGGKVNEELCHMFDLFVSGEWAALWQEATAAGCTAARSEQSDGVPRCPSHGTVQFCIRAGAVEGMCGRVAVGAGRPPCQVAEFQRSRGQGAEAAEDFGVVHSRFGSVESNCDRQNRAACRSSLWCFRQDGDTHRQLRVVSAQQQQFQSVVFVKSSCARDRAKYGLRGIRIGEAMNPGPVPPTQIDSSPTHVALSDTESVASEQPPSLVDALKHDLNGVPPSNRGRRLRLTWDRDSLGLLPEAKRHIQCCNGWWQRHLQLKSRLNVMKVVSSPATLSVLGGTL